jgi:hypothetical protein
MTVLKVLDHVSIMISGDCGKSYRTFLKNTQSQTACRTVDKTGDTGSFGTVAYCTDAGNGRIWILDGVMIDREVKHAE